MFFVIRRGAFDPPPTAAPHNIQEMQTVRVAAQVGHILGDSSLVRLARAGWIERARQFFKGAKAEDPGATSRDSQAKLFRAKSREWVLVVDQMLRLRTGEGLAKFVVDGQTAAMTPPRSWPNLSLSVDQGGDGWCALNWLLSNMKVNAFVISYPCHRCWNDCKKGARRVWALQLHRPDDDVHEHEFRTVQLVAVVGRWRRWHPGVLADGRCAELPDLSCVHRPHLARQAVGGPERGPALGGGVVPGVA